MNDFIQAKTLVEMELIGTSDKTLALTSGLVQHMESVLVENVREIPICKHRFISQNVSIADSTLKSLMADGTPYVRWRVGFVAPGQNFWLPWQKHQVVSYVSLLKGIGDSASHNLEIDTADRLYTLNRQSKIVSRKGKISDMVRQIASDAGLDAVIEPTIGTYAFVQVNESDYEFIKSRLIKRCVNDKGRGQYLLYIRDNVLHFHSPDYQTEIKQVVYYDTPFNRIAQADHSQQLFDAGASGTRLIAYDPYTGKSTEITNDAEKHLRLADGIYRLDKVPHGAQTMVYHLSSNQSEEANALAQNVYSFGRAQTFEIKFDVNSSLLIRAGDILQFIIAPQAEKTSTWSGYYLVSNAVRKVYKETLRTVYTLERGEIVRDQSTITQANDSFQLIPETTAPGQDLNVSTTQNSVLTVGAGEQESSTVYSTVKDANKAIVT